MRRTLPLAALLLALLFATAAWAAITGTEGPDRLGGTAGDDVIYGRGGDDAIDGAAGDDTLYGGSGADDLHGGPGQDAVVYADSAADLTVTVDGAPDDGAAGERDNVGADVEDVYGGSGADELTGNAAANTIDGGGGADRLSGGAGMDGLFGGDGDDRIDAIDGAVDTVDCGAGRDSISADERDVVSGCENRVLPQRATGAISYSSATRRGAYTIFTFIQVSDFEPGNAVAEVLCRGRGCPFTKRRFTAVRGKVNLLPFFARRRLRLGTSVEIRVVAPGTIGKVVRYTVKARGLSRTRLCLLPGAAVARRCP